MNILINLSKEELAERIWQADRAAEEILKTSADLYSAREHLFACLNDAERHYFNIYTEKFKDIHIIEKNNAKECIRVVKNIIRTENEQLTGFSALKHLFDIAQNRPGALDKVSKGFLCEFIFLFKGINGNSGIHRNVFDRGEFANGREGAIDRSEQLDEYAKAMRKYIEKYEAETGVSSEQRKEAKRKILRYFNATEEDWKNYRWHIKNVVKDIKTLSSLVTLEKDEIEGLRSAKKEKIPFQITPYYLSLFNPDGRTYADRALRAQVIPSAQYCRNVAESRRKGENLDFMEERSTSPVDLITRRYPKILIMKPFDSCPQICVYCQRNWEIKDIKRASITKAKLQKAIDWVKNNENISEVLLTGGDPLTLSDDFLDWLIGRIAKIAHIERIRIGTRTPVTLPFRIDDELLAVFKKYHKWGRREICVITHFEHPAEITPVSLFAVKKLKNLGINIYNQQVFTYFNSRRYETCFLRKRLKLIGIDPYYCFNTKGKEETVDFRVPMARIEQERKEEARLLPGVVRRDGPVFNVPRLGKSPLRSWQDHEPIMILGDGRRVYRFYPWESKLTITDAYLYTDVSIYDYLHRLRGDGENLNEYRTIWYYF